MLVLDQGHMLCNVRLLQHLQRCALRGESGDSARESASTVARHAAAAVQGRQARPTLQDAASRTAHEPIQLGQLLHRLLLKLRGEGLHLHRFV